MAGDTMTMKRTKFNIRTIAVTGMLGALATVLMFLEFPIPMLIPPFIKFDFSELPALLAAYAMGPVSGIAVCFIKNVINLLHTQTGGVGELSNFILGLCFVFQSHDLWSGGIQLGVIGADRGGCSVCFYKSCAERSAAALLCCCQGDEDVVGNLMGNGHSGGHTDNGIVLVQLNRNGEDAASAADNTMPENNAMNAVFFIADFTG